jgi:diaminopimelate epimerase
MFLEYDKFQGAGNDFIVIDNRDGAMAELSPKQIMRITDRKFGVGADGIILMNRSTGYDFHMEFYNPDGSKSFCGNGARCAVAFAQRKGFTMDYQRFTAIDGPHDYRIDEGISVLLRDVEKVIQLEDSRGLANTGSPHFIIQSNDLSTENVLKLGRQVRYSEAYALEGVNVNLAYVKEGNVVEIATYERGVESETLSCGTGATACALYFADKLGMENGFLNVQTKGGLLQIRFHKSDDGGFHNIWLSGPAEYVFSGNIEV